MQASRRIGNNQLPPWSFETHKSRAERGSTRNYEKKFTENNFQIEINTNRSGEIITAEIDYPLTKFNQIGENDIFLGQLISYNRNTCAVIISVVKKHRSTDELPSITEIPFITQRLMLEKIAKEINEPLLIKKIEHHYIHNKETLHVIGSA